MTIHTFYTIPQAHYTFTTPSKTFEGDEQSIIDFVGAQDDSATALAAACQEAFISGEPQYVGEIIITAKK